MSLRGQDLLKGVDLVVALRPDRFGDQVVDPHDQNILVLRAVEDADLALARGFLMDPPEEIVRQLVFAGRLEGNDLAALRVQGAGDVPDRPVFSAGVHRLQDDQDGTLVLGVEKVLELGKTLEVLLRLVSTDSLSGKPAVSSGSHWASRTLLPGCTLNRSLSFITRPFISGRKLI